MSPYYHMFSCNYHFNFWRVNQCVIFFFTSSTTSQILIVCINWHALFFMGQMSKTLSKLHTNRKLLPLIMDWRHMFLKWKWWAINQGINLKGCLYFIRKGNLKFSLSKWRVTSKTALHVCIEVFVETHLKICLFIFSNWHGTKYHQGPVTFFLPFILKGLQKITPPFLQGCKIFWRKCAGLDPKIRGIALQFYSLASTTIGSR